MTRASESSLAQGWTDPEGRTLAAKQAATHLVTCGPCSTQMTQLGTQDDVINYLGRRGAKPAPHVDQVLKSAAEAGKEQLVGLLIRMAASCLSRGDWSAYRGHFNWAEEPGDFTSLRSRFERVNPRIRRGGEGSDSLYCPPDGSGADAARRCLDVAQQLGVWSDWISIWRANAHASIGEDEEALKELTGVIHCRDEYLARESRSNFLASLIRLGRYQEAVEAGKRFRRLSPDDHVLLFNLAVAAGANGDRAWCEELLAEWRQHEPCEELARGLRSQAPSLSRVLRMTVPEVLSALGLSLE